MLKTILRQKPDNIIRIIIENNKGFKESQMSAYKLYLI